MIFNNFAKRVRHAAGAAGLGLALGLGLGLALVGPAHATCAGQDAFAALATTDPDTHARLTRAASETTNGAGIFWRIDVPGRAPSYLFGTKHSADQDISAELELARTALAEARLLLVELSPEATAEMQTALRTDPTIFMNPQGGVIEANIPPALIPTAEEVFLQYGLPLQVADRIEPWFLQMAMALPPCAVAAQTTNPERIMDQVIAAAAQDAGIEVRGLERWQDQLDVFRSMSDHDAREGLVFAIKTFPERLGDHAALNALYATRRIAEIWEFSKWRFEASEYNFETSAEAHIAEFERVLITDRNRLMAEKARPEVARGGVVIAVGALHLIGETGLVAAFQREGYEVTRLE